MVCAGRSNLGSAPVVVVIAHSNLPSSEGGPDSNRHRQVCGTPWTHLTARCTDSATTLSLTDAQPPAHSATVRSLLERCRLDPCGLLRRSPLGNGLLGRGSGLFRLFGIRNLGLCSLSLGLHLGSPLGALLGVGRPHLCRTGLVVVRGLVGDPKRNRQAHPRVERSLLALGCRRIVAGHLRDPLCEVLLQRRRRLIRKNRIILLVGHLSSFCFGIG